MSHACRSLLSIVFCLAFVPVCQTFGQPAIDYSTFALTGQLLPGATDGAVYGTFQNVRLNANGQVGFASQLSGSSVEGDVAFVSDVSGSLSTLARVGQRVPGLPDNALFAELFPNAAEFQINNAGQFILPAIISGNGISEGNDEILLSNLNGNSLPALREGNPTVDFANVPNPGIADPFFGASLTDQGSVIYTQNSGSLNSSLVLSQFNNMTTLILGPDDPVPSGDQRFEGLAFLRVNRNGEVGINARLSGNNEFITSLVETSSPFLGSGSFIDRGNGLETIALPGQPVPGGDPSFVLAGIQAPVIGGDTIAFTSGVYDETIPGISGQQSRSGVFELNEGQLQSIAAPGQTISLDGESHVVLNARVHNAIDTGQLLYELISRPEGTDDVFESRLVLFGENNHRTVVEGGAQVPGETEGVLFGLSVSAALRLPSSSQTGFIPNFDGFIRSSQGLGGDGQALFNIQLTGEAVDDSNNEGLFVEIDGQLRLLAREGSLFDVNDDPLIEDLRRISSIVDSSGSFVSFGSSDAGRSAFNDSGQVVANLEFADGTEGVFVFNASNPVAVPEPVMAGIWLVVAIAASARRMRFLEE